MARFLLVTSPVPGHVIPVGVLARELAARGHEVVWLTGAGFADRVRASGAQHVAMQPEVDWSLRHAHDAVPELREATGLAQVRLAFTQLFIDAAPTVLSDLETILTDFPADVVVANSLVIADTWLHERGGPPNARISTTMYGLYSRDAAPFGLARPPSTTVPGRARNVLMNAVHRRVVFRPVNRHLDDVRQSVGLPRQHRAVLDTFMSPYLWLEDTVESFEYPRSDLPGQVHFIGPLLPEPAADFAEPEWWPEVVSGRPVVLVTQGTVRNEDASLFAPTIAGLADRDVTVLVATGGTSADLPSPLPANVRAVDFVPFAMVMEHVSAFVTNGGFGGVQMALAHGVPMVVAGATEDKPEVGARVAWSGAGILLRGAPRAREVADAVDRVLSDGSYRANARRIRADIAATRPAQTGADLLERLAETGRPVLRPEATAYPKDAARRAAGERVRP